MLSLSSSCFFAGMVSPCWDEWAFEIEYQVWMMHERLTGCTYTSEWKRDVQILNSIRPIGLSRKECIRLLGKPVEILPAGIRYQHEVDELTFSKHGRYAISLYCDETCVSIAFMASQAPNCFCSSIHEPKTGFEHSFLHRMVQRELDSGSRVQPGYDLKQLPLQAEAKQVCGR